MVTARTHSEDGYTVSIDLRFSASTKECDWRLDQFERKIDELYKSDPSTHELGLCRLYNAKSWRQQEGYVHYKAHLLALFCQRSLGLDDVLAVKAYAESLGQKLFAECPGDSVKITVMTSANVVSYIRAEQSKPSLER